MGRWHRDELEEAFDKYREAARKGSSTGDWEDWVNCFTPDGTYIEHVDGDFSGQEDVYNPANFEKMITEWVVAKLDKSTPEEQERLGKELEKTLATRAKVHRGGISAVGHAA